MEGVEDTRLLFNAKLSTVYHSQILEALPIGDSKKKDGDKKGEQIVKHQSMGLDTCVSVDRKRIGRGRRVIR